jgi:hypothetical protein
MDSIANRWIEIAIVMLLLLFAGAAYWPPQTANMVVCSVTGKGRKWTVHTDTITLGITSSVSHMRLDPSTLAEQIQPNNEYELKYYGIDWHLGPFHPRQNLLSAKLIKRNVHSDTPICHETD